MDCCPAEKDGIFPSVGTTSIFLQEPEFGRKGRGGEGGNNEVGCYT